MFFYEGHTSYKIETFLNLIEMKIYITMLLHNFLYITNDVNMFVIRIQILNDLRIPLIKKYWIIQK